MIDLHTHILPGMDDGAPDVDTALAMLRMEHEQGVGTVALTPHFYPTRENAEGFLHRRSAAFDELQQAVEGEQDLPHMILGAEVAWVPGMEDWPELPLLCYGGTDQLLMELPFVPWNADLFRRLYNFMSRTGLTPVIAHIERYFFCQSRSHMRELLEMGLPMQVSAAAFLHLSGRHRALSLLQNSRGLVISDCHNTQSRPPNVGLAMAYLKKKLGPEAERIAADTDEALEFSV